jgi:hypothetical protein
MLRPDLFDEVQKSGDGLRIYKLKRVENPPPFEVYKPGPKRTAYAAYLARLRFRDREALTELAQAYPGRPIYQYGDRIEVHT